MAKIVLARSLASRLRQGEVPAGLINGLNTTYVTANKFVFIAGEVVPAVYYNGQRLTYGNTADFVVAESGGLGTGYDTIVLAWAPRDDGATFDRLLVDYLVQ